MLTAKMWETRLHNPDKNNGPARQSFYVVIKIQFAFFKTRLLHENLLNNRDKTKQFFFGNI